MPNVAYNLKLIVSARIMQINFKPSQMECRHREAAFSEFSANETKYVLGLIDSHQTIVTRY